MTSAELIRLIEELIELKIRQHVATGARASRTTPPHLARVISETNMADQRRLQQIRAEFASALDGSAAPEPELGGKD